MAGRPVVIVGEMIDPTLSVGGGPMPQPPGISGPGGPWPTPPIVIPQPPVGIWPNPNPPGIWGPGSPMPTPPIHIPQPPVGIWPGPGHPALPIVIPPGVNIPVFPSNPIVIRPGGDGNRPENPIVLPPGIWPGHPGGGGNRPDNSLPGGAGVTGPFGKVTWYYSPVYGLFGVVNVDPSGEKPDQGLPENPDQAPQPK